MTTDAPRALTRSCLLAVLLASVAALPALAQAQQCPQPRFTGLAPQEYLDRKSPLAPGSENVDEGERIFQGDDRAVSCATCHGKGGAGDGPLSKMFLPPPRNFTCASTINGVPAGHLFWIVRFGSPGTSMPAHAKLSEEQVWNVVAYLRKLAR